MENKVNDRSGSTENNAPEATNKQHNELNIGKTDVAIPPNEQSSNEASTPETTGNLAIVDVGKQPIIDMAKQDAPTTECNTATKSEKAGTPITPEEKRPETEKAKQRGKPAKDDKLAKTEKAVKPAKDTKAKRSPRLPKAPKQEKSAVTVGNASGGIAGQIAGKDNITPASNPATQEQPPLPREAPRPNGQEQIVYLNLTDLRPFKNHPFGIREDDEMRALVESVKVGGVNQPALVRPTDDGGYEIIAGHRRQKASELAGFFEMPCIVREMTDDEAVLAMTDDNLRQRSEILPSEKAQSLKMQFEAIKHQGTSNASKQNIPKIEDVGKRSIEIVGERNNMNSRQVQRYIRLTMLIPDLIKAVDGKKLGFTSAVEISFIKRKNQNLIAVSIDGQEINPSLSQAQRMRELDQKGLLNGDVIDGILCEQKKEVDKVIISGEELNKYFGKDKTPREMKDQIIKLLDEWAGKEKTINPPDKKAPSRD